MILPTQFASALGKAAVPRFSAFRSKIAGSLVVIALAACTGCWERVVYQASDERATMVRDEPVRDGAVREGAAPPVLPTPPLESSGDTASLVPTTDPPNGNEDVMATTDGETQSPPFDFPGPNRRSVPPALESPPPSTLAAGSLATSNTPLQAAQRDGIGAEAGRWAVSPDPSAPQDEPSVAQDAVLPDTRRAAWLLGSRLSLAALAVDAASSAENRARWFAEAELLAGQFQITLPPLPAALPDGNAVNPAEQPSDRVVKYLIPAGRQIAQSLDRSLGREHAALFEAALRSNLLLLLYEPDSPMVDAICEPLQGAVQMAQLPDGLFQPLYATLDRKAQRHEVRAEVLAVHRDIESHLERTPAVGQSAPANQTR